MLEISGLSKTYPNGFQALKDVSFSAPNGMFGLLGPNGAGKSTLMRILATLLEPDGGTVRLGDIDVVKDKTTIRERLGYLPQDFGVYPRTSAWRLLDHLATLKGVTDRAQRRQMVGSLLEQTNLYADRKRHVSSFSGGMRQRFGIAQALIGKPQLIIVDEPSAGLDPAERNRFHNLLSEIGQNVVVILSTHIVEDVDNLCQNMAVLAGGTVLSQGSPGELRKQVEGRIWETVAGREESERYANDLNVISTRLHAGRSVVHVLSNDKPGPSFNLVEPDLEDVYFSTLSQAAKLAPVQESAA